MFTRYLDGGGGGLTHEYNRDSSARFAGMAAARRRDDGGVTVAAWL